MINQSKHSTVLFFAFFRGPSISVFIIYMPLASLSHWHKLIDFLWCLRSSKFPQVSRILHSILVDLNDAEVWMIFILPSLSTSLSSLSKNLWIYPSELIAVGITVTLLFYNFSSSLARSKYLSLFHFLCFSLCG